MAVLYAATITTSLSLFCKRRAFPALVDMVMVVVVVVMVVGGQETMGQRWSTLK